MHRSAELTNHTTRRGRSFVFGPFTLQPERQTLKRGDVPVRLGSRALDMLTALVERPGEVVTKRELFDRVWPDTYVEEGNLKVNMASLRRALRDESDMDDYIATVVGRGYRFIAPVLFLGPGNVPPPLSDPLACASLPLRMSNIVGRDDTTAIISRALRERRLISVTGPAGIGKTTVAVAAARVFEPAFAGPIGLLDLSTTWSGEDALEAIARAFGIGSREGIIDALCDYVGRREVLLVLDTCEHIIEPMADLAETLLARCPGLKLLVTSRETLRTEAEWSVRLSPLTFPNEGVELTEHNIAEFTAVTLFLDRLRSTSGMGPELRELPYIAEICRRLDGIPLALELAAVRVPDLGLRDLARRIDDSCRILTKGIRTAPSRHQTLSAAISWSYNLLSDEEKETLRLIADLTDPLTAADAIGLGTDAGLPLLPELLWGLCDKSILTAEVVRQDLLYRLPGTTKAFVKEIVADLARDGRRFQHDKSSRNLSSGGRNCLCPDEASV